MTLVAIASDGPALTDGYRAVVGDGPMRLLESLAARLQALYAQHWPPEAAELAT